VENQEPGAGSQESGACLLPGRSFSNEVVDADDFGGMTGKEFVHGIGVKQHKGAGDGVVGKFGMVAGEMEPELLLEPILVIGSTPAGEIVFVEVLAGVAEGGDDLGVGEAVLEHEVDLVAEGGRELGDFAGATPLNAECGVRNAEWRVGDHLDYLGTWLPRIIREWLRLAATGCDWAQHWGPRDDRTTGRRDDGTTRRICNW